MQRLEAGCRLVGIQAALLTAAVHLLWAGSQLWATAGGASLDSRSLLFLPAALLLVAVAVALFQGYYYRRLSALGGGTLAALLGGYLLYHGRETASAAAADPLAVVALGAELVGVVAFLGLFYLHHPNRLGLGAPTASEDSTESDDDS